MILLDTSVLVEALTGPQRLGVALRSNLERGIRMEIPSLVLFEWRRGPRSAPELALQEALFPSEKAVRFRADEAILAARMSRSQRRSRSREVDLAIAACAITRDAELWTENLSDFADIPGLRIHTSF